MIYGFAREGESFPKFHQQFPDKQCERDSASDTGLGMLLVRETHLVCPAVLINRNYWSGLQDLHSEAVAGTDGGEVVL